MGGFCRNLVGFRIILFDECWSLEFSESWRRTLWLMEIVSSKLEMKLGFNAKFILPNTKLLSIVSKIC